MIGFWAKHLVDVWENTDRPIDWSVNETWVRLFFQYGLGNGWSVISNPEILYDWEGASDNRLYLPLGGGFAGEADLGAVHMVVIVQDRHVALAEITVRTHLRVARRNQAHPNPVLHRCHIASGYAVQTSDPVRHALALGLDHLVTLPGRLPPSKIAQWMQAADLFCLSSQNEGFPNVLLEAMAMARRRCSERG